MCIYELVGEFLLKNSLNTKCFLDHEVTNLNVVICCYALYKVEFEMKLKTELKLKSTFP